jgi:hypothetical protein
MPGQTFYDWLLSYEGMCEPDSYFATAEQTREFIKRQEGYMFESALFLRVKPVTGFADPLCCVYYYEWRFYIVWYNPLLHHFKVRIVMDAGFNAAVERVQRSWRLALKRQRYRRAANTFLNPYRYPEYVYKIQHVRLLNKINSK